MVYNKDIIQEGVINDIINLISDGGNVTNNLPFFKRSNAYFRNISSATSNLVLTFPVIVDETVSLNTATIFTKAVERKTISMLQMLFAAVNITNNADAFDFIGKVHKNLTSDDILSFINKIDSRPYTESTDNNITVMDIHNVNEAFIRELKKSPIYVDESLGDSLDDRFTITNESGRYTIHETNATNKAINKYKSLRKDAKLKRDNVSNNIDFRKKLTDIGRGGNAGYGTGDVAKLAEYDRQIAEFDEKIKNFKSIDKMTSGRSGVDNAVNANPQIKKLKRDMQTAIRERDRFKNRLERSQPDDSVSFYKNQIVASDIKKANEMVPSLMIIRFRTGESDQIAGTAMIGVKAKLVYVSQQDMIDRIILKNDDNNITFNLLRATTGEISFIKDFVLAIDRAKLDVFKTKHTSTPIWKMLERRASLSKVNRAFDLYNGAATAIATILISADTESILKKEYNFKITPYKILEIMKEYSAMGFAIADDVTEKIKVLYDDNSTNFETLSYASLERDNDEKQFKKMINLMIGK